MREFELALSFIEKCDSATTLQELREHLAAVLEDFGIPYFSLVAMLPVGRGGARSLKTIFSRTVNGWADYYWSEKAFNYDPAVHAALTKVTAFSWGDIDRRRFSKEARFLFEAISETMHVQGGYVIPLHDEEGFAGIIGLYHQDKELPAVAQRAVKLIAIYALERAKGMLSPSSLANNATNVCPLSARQREILSFAADGKSDWDCPPSGLMRQIG